MTIYVQKILLPLNIFFQNDCYSLYYILPALELINYYCLPSFSLNSTNYAAKKKSPPPPPI